MFFSHQSHTIHVWYIYLHLVEFYGKCKELHLSHGCYGNFRLIFCSRKNPPARSSTEDRDGTGHLTKHEFILSMQGIPKFNWTKKTIGRAVYININKLFGNFFGLHLNRRASPIGGAQRQKQTSKSQMAKPSWLAPEMIVLMFCVWNLHGLAFV